MHPVRPSRGRPGRHVRQRRGGSGQGHRPALLVHGQLGKHLSCRRRHSHGRPRRSLGGAGSARHVQDRQSVVSGKSVSVRVDLGGRRIIKTKIIFFSFFLFFFSSLIFLLFSLSFSTFFFFF